MGTLIHKPAIHISPYKGPLTTFCVPMHIYIFLPGAWWEVKRRHSLPNPISKLGGLDILFYLGDLHIRPKNHSKINPKPICCGDRKMDIPVLGLLEEALNAASRCHFWWPLSQIRTLAISEEARRRPKKRDTTQNMRSENDFKPKIIGFYNSIWKI